MEYFVKEDSVVRKIWASSDIIMFIFAGAAAEFALNKAVDWLYFTGKLPADPLGRLFSTVGYAKLIVFSEKEKANAVIDNIAHIHTAVENKRAMKIPDWAYRDVLFMLIDYSIRSFEVMQRKLTNAEKAEIFDTFYRVGLRMGIKDLPTTLPAWLVMRDDHLNNNIAYSRYTADLFKQYKKHLGWFRFFLLKEGQKLVAPPQVKNLLQLNGFSLLSPVVAVYKFSRLFRLDWFLKSLVLPPAYKAQVKAMDTVRSY
jgi:hypothetical protein